MRGDVGQVVRIPRQALLPLNGRNRQSEDFFSTKKL
jgi:hypothetical protein